MDSISCIERVSATSVAAASDAPGRFAMVATAPPRARGKALPPAAAGPYDMIPG